jgi:hypothetical protein
VPTHAFPGVLRLYQVGRKVSRGSMGPVAKPFRNDRCLRIPAEKPELI